MKEKYKVLGIYGIFLLVLILLPCLLYRVFIYEDDHYSYRTLKGESEIFLNSNYEKLR